MSDMSTQNNTPNTSSIDINNLAEVEDAKLRKNTDKSYSQGQMVWRRFRSHKAAMISSVVLVVVIILSQYILVEFNRTFQVTDT